MKKSLLVQKAFDLVQEHHGNVIRKSGEPYSTHLENVYTILKEYNFPEELLLAGLLHDIIEDSPLIQEDLEEQFGERVAFIVSAVSKCKKPPQPEKYTNPLHTYKAINKEFYEKLTKIESQNFRFLTYINTFYYSVVVDPWVAFLKIADQIDNMRDVEVFPLKKAKRKIAEIHFYFLPIYERITETHVMSHEVEEAYEDIKKRLGEIVEAKKKELGIDFGPIPSKKNREE